MESDPLLRAVHKASAVFFAFLALGAGAGIGLKALQDGDRAWLVWSVAVGGVLGLVACVGVLVRENRIARSRFWN